MATGGYAGIEDVQVSPAKKLDRMETFWLGETLSKSDENSDEPYVEVYADRKSEYLYLLFDDSEHIGLDQHVFNTEVGVIFHGAAFAHRRE